MDATGSDVTVQHVSIIVPAWNEESMLPRALEAIHRSARAAELSYEIVVADDASTDRTAQIARAAGAKVVACDNRQISATRNAGAHASSGDLLIFVDADTWVTEAVIRSTKEAIEKGATYGGADVTWDGEIPFWLRSMMRSTLFVYRLARLASGAFLFCTREAFDRAGGFDESLFAAEEYYFSLKLRKIGRYAWVKDRVVTSGRKLRTHSARELLRDVSRVMLGGKRGLRSREHLGLWYDARRVDPLTDAERSRDEVDASRR